MSWSTGFRTAARFTWIRVRRSWWLPAAVAGGLATGLVTVTQTVAGTGAGVLQQAAQFLSFLQVGVMVLAGLAADPERDEDSAAVLWSWPVDKAALVLGRFVGVAPLALLAALGAAVPPAVRIASLGRAAGLPWGLVLAEWGFLAAWILSGALWAAAIGGALGLWFRGLGLFAAILVAWLAGVLGPYVFQAVFNPFFPVAWLWQWTGSGMLPADFQDADLAGLAEDIPLYLLHRTFYAAAAVAVAGLLALLHRRRRPAGPGPRRWLGVATAGVAAVALAAATAMATQLYLRADAARQELSYYAQQRVYEEGEAPPPDPVPRFRVSRYELDLDVRQAPDLKAQARLYLENPGSEPVRDPVLTLRHVFSVSGLEVAGEGGGGVRWRREGDWIHLKGLVIRPGGSATVTLRYHGPVDQWILPAGYPVLRVASTELPETWRGAHVGQDGLDLPVSYGWYPLPGRVTLAVPIRLGIPGMEPGTAGLWLDEGASVSGTAVVRWAGPIAPAVDGDPGRFTPDPTTFRVTVRHPGKYPVLSNLDTLGSPWGPVTTMEGTTAYLHLVGRPLARSVTAGAEIWYPREDPGSLEAAREWAAWLREAYAWVGETVRPRVVTLPPRGTARIHRLFLDPATGAVLESGDTIMVPAQAIEAVLFGAREAISPAEQCLAAALANLVGAPPADAAAAPPGLHPDDPCASLPGSPNPGFAYRWARETPRSQVAAALGALRRLAAQRPLEPRDLWEVMGR
ncbi:MAG TPA: ABC transporter permease [Thermaerobacter sp.]